MLQYSKLAAGHPAVATTANSWPITQRPKETRRVHKLGQRVDEELCKIVVAAYESGTPTTRLTEAYGLGKGSVLKILSSRGVTMRRRGLQPEHLAKAIWLYESGSSIATIAAQFNVSGKNVHTRLREAGVAMRDTHGQPPAGR